MPYPRIARAAVALPVLLALLVPATASAKLTNAWSYSPTSPTVGQTVTFDASACQGRISDPSGYRWDLGNGTTKQGRKVTAAYSAAGTYHVKLTVTDTRGHSMSTTKDVTVASAPSTAVGASLPPRLPQSTGQTFYVSTTGADSNPGTIDAPWRTVQKAFDALQPGQTALVRAGTYSQNLVMKRAGTATAPITVRNYPGERPVLHPATTSPSYPLRLTTGAAFVRIQGFVIENAQGASTMNVVGLGSNPGAHDYEIADCEIRFARNSSGVFIDNTNYNVWLLANSVHDNNEPGVQHQGIYDEADNSVIADNVVYHQTDGFGIQVRSDAPSGPNNVTVANNTVSDVSLSGIMIEHTVSNATIVNNISAFNAGTGIRGYFSSGDHPNDPVGTNNVARHNLVYGNHPDLGSDPTPSGATILSFTDNAVADPLFADRTAADFRPLAGSPAVDAALTDLSPAVDRLLHPRPLGAAPDLGAYEVG